MNQHGWDVVDSATVADEAGRLPAGEKRLIHHGMIWDVVSQSVDLGDGGTVTREFIEHPGAVWVMVLDERERVLLQRQYRHPVGMYLWEPPAGLCDVAGEPPFVTAQRELREEADLLAATWNLLAEPFTSPGGSSERIWLYLARDLSEVPDDEKWDREAEEIGMKRAWLTLSEAEDAVFAGRLHSPAACVGTLAVLAAARRGFKGLRPAE